MARLKLPTLLYPPKHPLGHDPLGFEKTVAALSREDVVTFYRRRYRPDQLLLGVVGGIRLSRVKERLDAVSRAWKGQARVPVKPFGEMERLKARRVERVVMEKPEAYIMLAHKGLHRSHPDYYPLMVGVRVLGGGGLNSRLWKELRGQRGLTYGVYAYLRSTRGKRPLTIQMQVHPSHVDEAIQETLKIVAELKAKGVTQDEVDRVKDSLINSFPSQLEMSADVAGLLVAVEFHGLGLDFVHRYVRAIRGVTRARVNEALRKYLDPDRFAIVVAGPPEKH